MAKKRKARRTKKRKVVKKKARRKKVVRRKKVKRKVRRTKKRKVVKKKAKKKAKKKVKKKARKKRKLNPALMRSYDATPALAAVVGARRITRQKAIKYFWNYVKRRNLQDSRDRRNINLDDMLKKLFGNKRQVSMFEATKIISRNLK